MLVRLHPLKLQQPKGNSDASGAGRCMVAECTIVYGGTHEPPAGSSKEQDAGGNLALRLQTSIRISYLVQLTS